MNHKELIDKFRISSRSKYWDKKDYLGLKSWKSVCRFIFISTATKDQIFFDDIYKFFCTFHEWSFIYRAVYCGKSRRVAHAFVCIKNKLHRIACKILSELKVAKGHPLPAVDIRYTYHSRKLHEYTKLQFIIYMYMCMFASIFKRLEIIIF